MSYHDLHITTPTLQRTSIFNLPLNIILTCTRTGGWELWDMTDGFDAAEQLAAEYWPEKWLVLDVAGHLILDSRKGH